MRYLLIYNPKAGNSTKKGLLSYLSNLLNEQSTAITISKLNDDLCKAHDVLVAIGGDGTINSVAKLAIAHDKILAIIPSGSGNGLARHLQIPMQWKESVKKIMDGQIQNIDVCYANDQLFVNIAGLGFEGFIANVFNQGSRRGLLGYIKTVATSFKRYHEFSLSLQLDDVKSEQRVFSLSIANGSQWGNNFYVASASNIQDGVMEVTVMRKPKWYQVPQFYRNLKANKPLNNRLFERYSAQKIIIESRNNAPWHLDGEPVELGKKVVIHLVPGSLKVIA